MWLPNFDPVLKILLVIGVLGFFGNLLRVFAKPFKNTDAIVRIYWQHQRGEEQLPSRRESILGWLFALIELFFQVAAQGTEGPFTAFAGILSAKTARAMNERMVKLALAGGASAAFATLFGGNSWWMIPMGTLFAIEFFCAGMNLNLQLAPFSLLSCITAWLLTHIITYVPQFDVPLPNTPFWVLPVLGVLCGGIGVIYVMSLEKFKALAAKLRQALWLLPFVAGLVSGGMSLLFPTILGPNDVHIRALLIALPPLLFVLALPFAKILATTICAGFGCAGGTLGPATYIGAATGAALWEVAHLLGVPVGETAAPMVLIASCAFTGPVAGIPLAMILASVARTNDPNYLVPTLIAMSFSYVVSNKFLLYPSQRLSQEK
jgi:H+/Cl- antiporter ClcA